MVGYLDDRYIVSIYILTGNPGLGMQLTLNDFDYKDDPHYSYKNLQLFI
jgi:hypothetical protein